MGFQDLLAKKGGFWGQNRGRGGAILTPNKLILTFRGFYVCANFGENRSRNATVRVPTDGQTRRQTDRQTDRHTDTNRFYNLSHAICYSYGTDNNNFVSLFIRLISRSCWMIADMILESMSEAGVRAVL